jgi:proteasome lid subunit RPN8/RPN11
MTGKLIFANDELTRLRDRLLKSSPDEAAAVLFANQGGAQDCLLVDEARIVPGDQYQTQTPSYLSVNPSFLAKCYKQAREQHKSILLAHTHPFTEWPAFSDADDAGERASIPALFGRVPGVSHGTLVLGTVGCAARLYSTPDECKAVHSVTEVGAKVRIQHLGRSGQTMDSALDRVDVPADVVV